VGQPHVIVASGAGRVRRVMADLNEIALWRSTPETPGINASLDFFAFLRGEPHNQPSGTLYATEPINDRCGRRRLTLPLFLRAREVGYCGRHDDQGGDEEKSGDLTMKSP